MLKAVVDVAVPVLVFLMMTVVGLGLTTDDFRRVARRPRLVVGATVGQFVVLPVLAVALVRSLSVAPELGRGILLVAACPAGSMATFYAYLARANVALAVTLTAVSCATAVLSMPLVLLAFRAYLGESAAFDVPTLTVVGHLCLTLLLPVLCGMAVRRLRPTWVARHRRGLFGLSILALAVLIGFVINQEATLVAREFGPLGLAVAALTLLELAAGWAVGWACGAHPTDRFTVATVFVVRNVGIATTVAVTVLGRTEFAASATVYFLTQVPLLLLAVLVAAAARLPAVAGEGG